MRVNPGFIKRYFWVAAVIMLIVAAVLRFWQLGTIPLGFHADEAAYGYNAYSILKTGRDEFGVRLPLVLKSFGDYKAAVDAYLAVPFIYLWGLKEWTVRAPSAVFGILFVILTYLLVLRLSGRRGLALISMGLASISPVGILLSRVQSDPLICATFFFFALYVWLVWLKKRNGASLVLLGVLVLLSFFTYTITRLFSLPFLAVTALMYWKYYDRTARMVFGLICAGILITVTGLYLSPAGVWFSEVSVFSSKNVQIPLEEEISDDGSSGVPLLATRIIHNKVISYGRYLIKNYTDYLSFEFLFTQAREPLREQVPHQGVLMLADLPFLLVGIYMSFRKRLRYGIFSVLWVLSVPLVLSVASAETPNIHRFILAMIPLYLLIGLGISSVYQTIRTRLRPLFVGLILLLFTANLAYDMHQLFIHQPIHASMYRNDEYKRLVLAVKKYYPSYDVIVSPQILEHILFYFPIDPATYQKIGSPRDVVYGRFDKFFFVSGPCPSRLTDTAVKSVSAGRVLYIDKAECNTGQGDILIGTIRLENSLPVYYLVEKSGTVR